MRGHTVRCMLQYLIILALLAAHMPILAAKKRRGRVIAVRVHVEFALSTLADNTVLSTNLFQDSVEGNTLYMISADLVITARGITAGEGPILIGCSDDDYSVTEIKECIEADNLDLSDQIQMERARRKVRIWGQTAGAATDEVLNNGNIKRYRMRIMSQLGHNLSLWAMNLSGGTLTTGQVLVVTGTAYLRRI